MTQGEVAIVESTESKKSVTAEQQKSKTDLHAILVCLFVAVTGFNHGYDNGVISDVYTMESFRAMMGWPEVDDASTAGAMALNTNMFNAGAAVAAVLSGPWLVDLFGRKPSLLIGSTLFAIGGLVQSLAHAPWQLYIGRIIAGVGVGITSTAGPSYISEVAPARVRGAMVGIYQSNVCVGIVGASFLNHFLEDDLNGWRYSLGVQVLLGCMLLAGSPFLKETPRFLETRGRSAEALEVLKSLRGGDEAAAQAELKMVQVEIEEEMAAGKASWSEIFTNSHFRNVVLIGCVLQFFQIMTGINAMVSYFGTLAAHLGMKSFISLLSPNLAFTLGNAIGSFYLADRVGRRPLLIWGMLGMAVSMLAAGVAGFLANSYTPAGILVILMVVCYNFAFGISWGFGAWLYVSEVMPLRVRGSAVGLCTAMNWGPANIISGAVTPIMLTSPLGPGGTLMFFGVVCAIVVPFSMTCIPETKGKTLEEITPLFRFSGWTGFMNFIRGNIHGGQGASWISQKYPEAKV